MLAVCDTSLDSPVSVITWTDWSGGFHSQIIQHGFFPDKTNFSFCLCIYTPFAQTFQLETFKVVSVSVDTVKKNRMPPLAPFLETQVRTVCGSSFGYFSSPHSLLILSPVPASLRLCHLSHIDINYFRWYSSIIYDITLRFTLHYITLHYITMVMKRKSSSSLIDYWQIMDSDCQFSGFNETIFSLFWML